MTKVSQTTTKAGAILETSVHPLTKNSYMSVDIKVTDHDNILDALKAQAAKNLEVVNEIIAKADAFDSEYKPKQKRKK